LAELGHTTAAMDVFAQRGDWERVWEMAAKERVSATVLARYSAMRVQQLLEEFSGEITSHEPRDFMGGELKPRLGRGAQEGG
jgi:hypothetical protein